MPRPVGDTYGRPAPHSATQRYDNYSRKLVPVTISGYLTPKWRGRLHNNLSAQLALLEAVYTGVQAILADVEGVTTFLGTGYQNMARQLWYAKQHHTGTTLESEAWAIIGDWIDRGLVEGTVWLIATGIFGIPQPPG